jgi:hypothetical protein
MVERKGDGSRRYTKLIVSLAVALSLVGCGGLGGMQFLPHQNDVTNANFFKSYDDVKAAYQNVVPGRTRTSDLTRLGFDSVAQPNVEVLSYLGVIERFMPRDSIKFDRLAGPVQACIEAQDRCSAYVFRPSQLEQKRTGNVMLDLLGFERTTEDRGWSAEIVLLLQDGRVSYKVMSGRPHIEGNHDDIQPLGPLQNLGTTATQTAARIF